jgi:Type IV secretion system pilin
MNKIAMRIVKVSGVILISTFILGAAISFLPPVASGACDSASGVICPPNPGINNLGNVKDKILCNALNWLFTAAIVISIGAIIFGAISYITSGGGEKVAKVHQAITYAVVGIVVAILAKGIPVIISAFLSTGATGTNSVLDANKICP